MGSNPSEGTKIMDTCKCGHAKVVHVAEVLCLVDNCPCYGTLGPELADRLRNPQKYYRITPTGVEPINGSDRDHAS